MKHNRKSALLTMMIAQAVALAGCATQQHRASTLHAPELDAQERQFTSNFDALMRDALARLPSIPAVAVTVVRGDRPIYVHAFGMADIEQRVPATTSTRFYLASTTKSYVGLAFALLDRRGVIDLDWTLSELAPDVPFPPELHASDVTLRHLLSHTHGLIGPAMQFRLAYSGEHDPQTLWRLLGTLRPNREAPLGTFAYSNIGYNIAALLIERRLGRPWQQIVEKEVLAPLGAHETEVRGMDRLRAAHLVAAPYMGLGPHGPERLSLIKVDSNMQSAGGLFASANDLAQSLRLQLAAHRAGARGPLPSDVVAATHRPIATLDDNYGPFRQTGYGLGWYSGPFEGEPLYHSFGGYAGARSHVSFMPSRDLGIAAVTNDEGAGSMLVDIAAIYTYAWFADGPDVAQRQANELIEQLVTKAAERARSLADDRARRATRAWQLSLPKTAYSGRYCNDEWGSIAVDSAAGRTQVSMGALSAEATPSTEPDTMRVEFIPYQGAGVAFIIANGQVTGLRAFHAEFTRCG